jgi:hypothetical protein
MHIKGLEDYPQAIWDKLKQVHQTNVPGARFNAYSALLNVKKEPGESLQALIGWVDALVQQVKDLRLLDYTIESLDKDLTCMALVRALPEEYSHFSSSLLLLLLLDPKKIKQAFITEDIQSQVSLSSSPATSSAHFSSSSHSSLSKYL